MARLRAALAALALALPVGVPAALGLLAAAPAAAQEPVPPEDSARAEGEEEEPEGGGLRDAIRGLYGAAARGGGPRRPGVRVRPLFPAPATLYSPSRGFGIGGGIQIDGLGAPDSELELQGRLQQHIQSVETLFLSGDRYRRPLYVMVGGSFTTTDRYPYYGTGPRSNQDGKLYLDQRSSEVETRVGVYPTRNTILYLQPVGRFRVDRLVGYEPARDSALFVINPADTLLLASLRGTNRHGVEVGLEAASDSRDRLASPNRGFLVQGGLTRFFSTDGSGLRFNRAELSAYRFFPAPIRLPFLPERGAVFLRGSFAMTRQEAPDTHPLPHYYLPILDAELLAGYPPRRFVGRDGLSLGIGTRGTIYATMGTVLVEGFSLLMLGGAYDDVFDQFTARVTLDPDPVDEGERVPLRPSLAVGLNLVTIDRDRPIIGGSLGFGPEGIVFSSFRIVYDIRSYRPRVR